MASGNDVQRKAACSCGQLSLTVRGDPHRVSVCHCLACQRRTGSLFGVQARFPSNAASIEGLYSTYERSGDSGSGISFNFCPQCGSTVFYTLDNLPDAVGIPVGMFGDPEFPEPTVSIFEAHRHSWVSVPEDAECCDGADAGSGFR